MNVVKVLCVLTFHVLLIVMILFFCSCYRDAAISLWSDVEENDFELFLLCARHPGTDFERNAFHAKVHV